MSAPELEVVGVNKVECDEQAFNDAVECSGDEATARAELGSIVLIECDVQNADGRFDVGDFCQEGSDQVAHAEVFLDAAGNLIAQSFERPDVNSFRVCFYLHYFEPAKPLRTSYGPRALPTVEPLPERLSVIVPPYEYHD